MTGFQIFFLRVILGAAFAVVISRFFYPDTGILPIAGLGILLVGLAYFAETLRNKRSKKRERLP